jgi:hypothetical protein
MAALTHSFAALRTFGFAAWNDLARSAGLAIGLEGGDV